MSSNEESKPPEILIIRRGGHGGEEGHHGGVWKIAYADFMTAMMAFFLVMWLINSTDQKTLTQVATYFNPLRLTDKTPTSRGMQQDSDSQTRDNSEPAEKPTPSKEAPGKGAKSKDGGAKADSKSKSDAKSDAKADTKADAGKGKFTEDALFRDPYGVLDKIAADAARDQGRPAPRARGEAFRDPFDPAFRRETHAGHPDNAGSAGSPAPEPSVGPSISSAPHDASTSLSSGPLQAQPNPASKKSAAAQPAQGAEQKAGEQKSGEQRAGEQKAIEQKAGTGTADDAKAKAARQEGEEASTRKAAEKLAEAVRQIVAQAGPGAMPNITVTATSEGVLISLTDSYEFGMFAIASAEPRPAMVLVMDKLAKLLAGLPGPLVVRGHTDGRPYKTGTYDNWRLSTARAHMAYYMLVRGGIEEKRFDRVEGYADRNLRIPGDPEAAQNRRIEILLRKATS